MRVKLPEVVGIYKRKRERKKKERKHALDQESDKSNDQDRYRFLLYRFFGSKACFLVFFNKVPPQDAKIGILNGLILH